MAHHHRHGPPNQLPLTDFTIFPPIGIARVGNSPDGWFYGPEIPDRLYATPPPPENPDYYREPAFFKDDNGAIKRQVKFFFSPSYIPRSNIQAVFRFGQAARFRVFGKNHDGKWIEANKTNGYELVWEIQVANKKASWYNFRSRSQFHHLKLTLES